MSLVMAEIETRNLVAGEWVSGDTTLANINPSDITDVIGHHAQASETAHMSQRDHAQTSETAHISQRDHVQTTETPR